MGAPGYALMQDGTQAELPAPPPVPPEAPAAPPLPSFVDVEEQPRLRATIAPASARVRTASRACCQAAIPPAYHAGGRARSPPATAHRALRSGSRDVPGEGVGAQTHDLEFARYNEVVLDTAPSRHALDFLDYPARLGRMLEVRTLEWRVDLAKLAGSTLDERGVGFKCSLRSRRPIAFSSPSTRSGGTISGPAPRSPCCLCTRRWRCGSTNRRRRCTSPGMGSRSPRDRNRHRVGSRLGRTCGARSPYRHRTRTPAPWGSLR